MNNQRSMNRQSLVVATFLLSLVFVTGCQTAPGSGSRQVALISEPHGREIGATAVQDPFSYGASNEESPINEESPNRIPSKRAPVVSREQASATLVALARQRESKLNRQREIDLVGADKLVKEEQNPMRREKIKQYLTKSLYKEKPQVLKVPRPFELDQPQAVAPKPLRVPEFNPLRD